jgi:nucleobase:cation symporter-1, NCS1 family
MSSQFAQEEVSQMAVTVNIAPDGRQEFVGTMERSNLYNKDLAPTPIALRTWKLYTFLAFWIGCCVVIPSWSLANVGLSFGMDWVRALSVVILGNIIVSVPLLLNSHVGAKYGIPFPVFVRASFGTFGANIATLLRAFVACGWMGIESWIGGYAMYVLVSLAIPAMKDAAGSIGLWQYFWFAVFWIVQVWLAVVSPPEKASKGIKIMFDYAAPFLLVFTLLLFVYEVIVVPGGLDAILKVSLASPTGKPDTYLFWLLVNINVGFWATMALNISDVTRFANDQKGQIIGQGVGLIGTMAFFSGLGILVTMGGTLLFPQTLQATLSQGGGDLNIWNPINLFALLSQKLGFLLILFALVFVILAQLTTNIGANIIAPANDFQNLNPKRLDWKAGVIITGIVGVIIRPWELFFDPTNYAVTWLSGYGGFLGAIGGIMIADYWLLRKRELRLLDLFKTDGVYNYGNKWGVNPWAVVALLCGILPPFIGWLHAVKYVNLGSWYAGSFLDWLQTGSWFWSFFVALAVYYILMKTVGAHYVKDQTK